MKDDRDFFLSGAGRRGKRGITLTYRVEKKYSGEGTSLERYVHSYWLKSCYLFVFMASLMLFAISLIPLSISLQLIGNSRQYIGNLFMTQKAHASRSRVSI